MGVLPNRALLLIVACGGAEVVCLTDDGRTADVFGEEEEEGGT